jgi:hypothetical protein
MKIEYTIELTEEATQLLGNINKNPAEALILVHIVERIRGFVDFANTQKVMIISERRCRKSVKGKFSIKAAWYDYKDVIGFKFTIPMNSSHHCECPEAVLFRELFGKDCMIDKYFKYHARVIK